MRRVKMGRWFSETVDSLPVGDLVHNEKGRLVDSRLARIIGGVADGRVSKWRQVPAWEAPVDADVAYRVGDALTLLGAPQCLPPMAVLAAGRLDQFLRYLRRLGNDAPSMAVEVFAYAPALSGLMDVEEADRQNFLFQLQRYLKSAGKDAINKGRGIS